MTAPDTPGSGEYGAYYYGCWESQHPGHGLHQKNGRTIWPARSVCPWTDARLELLAPRTGTTISDGAAGGKMRQGAALLHHKAGWTALAVDDFTGDSRPNSKSVFVFPEVLGWDDAWAAAREHFPRLAERCGTPFDLSLSGASGSVDG